MFEKKSKLLKALDGIYSDQLEGGKADVKKPSDFQVKAVLNGILVELEHTKDEMKALEIAMDHLQEDAKYYEKLAIVEGPEGEDLLEKKTETKTLITKVSSKKYPLVTDQLK